MQNEWFSLRMRATRAGRHLSGAERITRGSEVAALTTALTERALTHRGGQADQVHCTVERLQAESIHYAPLPEVHTWLVRDWLAGRQLAGRLLRRAGVASQAAEKCLQTLAKGPGPGGQNMRGAMIVDAENGQRLESDWARGLRVSQMDIVPEERREITQALAAAELGHHRVLEALALAGKVLHAPGLVAELCWSDDPDYLSGYVASPADGYQRISPLKEAGSAMGGRAFLIDRKQWRPRVFSDFLEKTAMLLHGPAVIHPFRNWEP